MANSTKQTAVHQILALATLAALFFYGCANSGFTGSSASKKANPPNGLDANGSGTGDANDTGEPDSGDTDTSDSEGDNDTGDADSGSGDNDGDGDNDGSDIDDGDDTNSLSTRHDMIVTRVKEDFDDLKVKIEVVGKDDDTELSETIDVPEKKSVTVKNACRTGGTTKLQLTFIGKVTVRPGDKCAFLTDDSDTLIKIDVDTESFFDGVAGGCKPGEDDSITFECPKSKRIEVEGF